MKRTTQYMARALASLFVAALVGASAQAATISTNMTITALASLGASITATGTAVLTNIGNGTFTATMSLTTTDSKGNFIAPYTITLSGGAGTITGTLSIPPSVLSGGTSASGSGTVTGGTGTYAGATGSFPSLSATGSLSGLNLSMNINGAGTVVTGGAPPTTPTITAVLDAGGYTKNVAQGSVFVIKGTNLGGSGFQATALPFPDTFSGVTITFTPTTGGTATKAYVVYLYNQGGLNQLAALLPSTVPPGNYNVIVTNSNGTSAGFATQVVARKPGLITADSSGSGLALVNPYNSAGVPGVNRLTTFSCNGFTCGPAKPGQFIGAWATGLGPVTGADNAAQPVFDMSKNGVNVSAIVGGVTIPVAFAGRAPGGAGGDQINFQLPNNIPTGCTVSFQVSVNGILSNATYIAIAPDANATACVMPGFTTAQLQNFDNGGSYTAGSFSMTQTSFSDPSFGTFKSTSAGGAFTKFTGTQLAGLGSLQVQTSTTGACQVIHVTGTQTQLAAGGGIGLDAGAVTLNGPSGSSITNLAFTQDASNSYSLSLGTQGLGVTIPGQINATIVPGAYSIKGAGGADVGAFNASVNLGTPLTLGAPLPASVNRSNSLTLNWTGGNSSDIVQIFGYSGSTTGTGVNAVVDATEFICTTTAGPGTFTVPASVLSQLPATASTAAGGTGFLELSSGVNTTFTAPLKAGGNADSATWGSFLGFAATTQYQ